jgi:hypothetical protein
MTHKYENADTYVRISFVDLVSAVSELCYDEIVELIVRVDADQADSMFTDMLRKAVEDLD